jgi:hypothetical protein
MSLERETYHPETVVACIRTGLFGPSHARSWPDQDLRLAWPTATANHNDI